MEFCMIKKEKKIILIPTGGRGMDLSIKIKALHEYIYEQK